MRGRIFGFQTGSQLWLYPEDVSLELLGFLRCDDICELACACLVMRSMCCVSLGGWQWKMLSPHVQLSSRACNDLRQIWLPRTRWLEARDLSAKACRNLFAALQAPGDICKGLLTVDLRNSKFDPACVGKLLTTCAGLCSLQLSRSKLKDGGAAYVTRALTLPHRGLKELYLEENGLTSLSGPGLACALRAAPLECLVLAKNDLGDDGIQALAEALSGCWPNHRLKQLDVSENKITAVGMASLLAALRGNRTLNSLDLGGNDTIGGGLLHGEAQEEVAEGLVAVGGLRDLHLWRCGLADAACSLVVDAKPPKLELLNLAANPISGALKSSLLRAADGTEIRI